PVCVAKSATSRAGIKQLQKANRYLEASRQQTPSLSATWQVRDSISEARRVDSCVPRGPEEGTARTDGGRKNSSPTPAFPFVFLLPLAPALVSLAAIARLAASWSRLLLISELKTALGPLSARDENYCSEACLMRYLEARNWNVSKSRKMLEESLKWRASYRPEDIRWNSTSHEGKIRFLVYVLENAILNLPEGQEKMVWLIDFTGWTMADATPMKTARESTSILQNHYPERLAIAFLFNPPKIFETFYKVVKIFLDPKSLEKVNFVYAKDEESMKLMHRYIDPEVLPVEFGGKNNVVYNHEEYSKLMVKDDVKAASFWADAKTDHANHDTNGTFVPEVTPQSSLVAAKAS
ncbi:hypothetical protein EJB05_04814, partial [Eragrostis curvula]